MTYRVIVRASAESDLLQAQRWYDSKQPNLGTQFRAAFGEIVDVIRESPLIYPVVYRDARRAVMSRFPYLVYFVVRGQFVEVAACLHGSRDPELFKSYIGAL